MPLDLNASQYEALTDLVARSLGELSSEIAATDNWEYRKRLRFRRDRLMEVLRQLDAVTPVRAP